MGMLWLISLEAVKVSKGVEITVHPWSSASFLMVMDTGAPSQTTIHPAFISMAQSWDS